MKKLTFLLPAFATLALVACNANTASTVTTNSSSSMAMEDSDHDMDDVGMSSGSMMPASSADASVSSIPAGATVINMNVSDWEFSPSTVTIKKGAKVVIHLTGVTGEHSFASADLGINVSIDAGETKDIVIPTEKAGTFSFRCTVPCGPGHRDMKGTIVIEG